MPAWDIEPFSSVDSDDVHLVKSRSFLDHISVVTNGKSLFQAVADNLGVPHCPNLIDLPVSIPHPTTRVPLHMALKIGIVAVVQMPRALSTMLLAKDGRYASIECRDLRTKWRFLLTLRP